MYFIELSQRAQKFLNKLDNSLKIRLEKTLKNRLEDNPVPSGAKFVYRDKDNNKVFRYRIGDYRALYIFDENKNIII